MTIDTEVQRLVKEEIAKEEQARIERIKQTVLERKAAEDAEQARQARIAAVYERVPVELDPAPLEEAEAELLTAYERYMGIMVAHDKRFAPLWLEISNLAGAGPLPEGLAASHIYGGMISMGGRDYRKSRLHTRLIRAAQAAINQAQPLDHVDLSRNPQD